jgi:predicted NBD/HSP70 family sugar kinase
MRFYNQQHKFYFGIDLHASKMYVCIVDQKGKTRVHQNLKTDPEMLFDIIFPFLEDVVIWLCVSTSTVCIDRDSFTF